MLSTILILAVAGLFALMGVAALFRPERITIQFGIPELTTDGRNEVRAVYGGFGIAIALLLLAALGFEPLRTGAVLAVAAAVYGMAGGRLLSFVFDGALGKWPGFYLLVELVLGTVLVAAVWLA